MKFMLVNIFMFLLVYGTIGGAITGAGDDLKKVCDLYNLNNKGAVAQLGERLDGIQKVVGSIPSSSTKNSIKL